MTDMLSPANAPFAVTVRPAESRTFSTADTWFQDCSSPDADDGTDIQAGWLNGVVAAMRALVRGNGNLLDGTTKVVPEVGTDDNLLLKAVQQLFQRAQPAYGVDTGAKNALVVSLTPALLEYKAGAVYRVKILHANDGATTININGLGVRDVKTADGSALATGHLIAGGIAEFIDDGTKVQLVASHTDQTGGGGSGYRTPYATAGGSATVITATYSPTTATPVAGDLFLLKLVADIAGATTFNHDSHGAKDLVDPGGNALTLQYAMSGDVLLIMYDGVKMRVISKTSAAAPGVPLMTPGAIGSLAFAKYTIDPSIYPNGTSQSAATATYIALGYGPGIGYVYGAYISGDSQGWINNSNSFSGVWRCLSIRYLDYVTTGGPLGIGMLALCQRVA